jgi:hypothetical protein
MDYANAGDSPYTATQVITNAYSIIFNMELFLRPAANRYATQLQPPRGPISKVTLQKPTRISV